MSLFEKIKKYINIKKDNNKDKQVEYDTSIKLNDVFVNNDDPVGMIYDLIIKELDLYEQDYKFLKNKSNLETRRKEVEEKILNLIEEDDRVLAIQDLNKEHYNIGMVTASLKLENIVLRALDDPIASLQQDKRKLNLGTISAFYKLEKATMKALDNVEASLQQDEWGMNMGMMAANCGMEKCVLKALDNKEACSQIDMWGDNLGIYCAREQFNEATLKALDNAEMSTHINETGGSMAYIITIKGMKECLKKVLSKYPETIETFSVGCTRQMILDIEEAKRELEEEKSLEDNIDNNLEIEIENE